MLPRRRFAWRGARVRPIDDGRSRRRAVHDWPAHSRGTPLAPRRDGDMPARDRYHDQVKNALIKDGWTITDDPLHVRWGKKDMYVDLGAQQLLAAEKEHRKIAVEVKSFLGESEMADLEQAIGQYTVYHEV